MYLRRIAHSGRSNLIIATLVLCLAFLTALNSSLFLAYVGEYVGLSGGDGNFGESLEPDIVIPSAQEIMIQSVYGINDNGRKQIVDIVGFALPYLILVLQAGLLLTLLTEDGSRYMYIIRYESYSKWLLRNLSKISFGLISLWTLFYMAVFIFSFLLADHTGGLGGIFYHLNIYASPNVSFVEVVVFQYAIGCLTCFLIASSQFMISIILKDAAKAYVYLSMFILLCAFLGMFRIYNPLMMSKHGEINNLIGVSPLMTLGLLLGVSLGGILINKRYLRRKGL